MKIINSYVQIFFNNLKSVILIARYRIHYRYHSCFVKVQLVIIRVSCVVVFVFYETVRVNC